MSRSWFPLQWPEGWTRTPFTQRTNPRFASRFTDDRDAVLRRLERRGGRNIVITSQLPLSTKGMPYMGPIEDPGIAVYWFERRGKAAATEHVLACDQWARIGDNLRAIMKTLEALDGIDRWGASQIIDRVFSGFAALPPGSSSTIPQGPTRKPWRDVLANGKTWPDLPNDELLAIMKTRHRQLIEIHHPDKGGVAEMAADINAAKAEAEAELGA